MYFSPVFAIAYFGKQLVRNMAAKLQIKNDRINSFGGFFAIEQFRASGFILLVNNTLVVSSSKHTFDMQNNDFGWKRPPGC